ncbi:dynein light chain Tctex-type 1-like [Tautogolabrus adspersus]
MTNLRCWLTHRDAVVSYLEAAEGDEESAGEHGGLEGVSPGSGTVACVIFNVDETNITVKECIEGVIGGTDYDQSKVNQWTASIVEHSLTHLVKQGRPFKFIVNCSIMQKTGAGLHTANSCYWDTATDGSCTVRWENRTMYCVVSVFAVAVAL